MPDEKFLETLKKSSATKEVASSFLGNKKKKPGRKKVYQDDLISVTTKLSEIEIRNLNRIEKMLGVENTSLALKFCFLKTWEIQGEKIEAAFKKMEEIKKFTDPAHFLEGVETKDIENITKTKSGRAKKSGIALISQSTKLSPTELENLNKIGAVNQIDNTLQMLRYCYETVWDTYGEKIKFAAEKRDIINEFIDPIYFLEEISKEDGESVFKIIEKTTKEIKKYKGESEGIAEINGIPLNKKDSYIICQALPEHFNVPEIMAVIKTLHPDYDHFDTAIRAAAYAIFFKEEGILKAQYTVEGTIFSFLPPGA